MATTLTATLTHLKCSARACCLAVTWTASSTVLMSPLFVSSRAAFAWAWAVAGRGEAGVRHVLEVMKADLDTALGLTGQTAIADVDRSALYDAGAALRER